jgi:hypothetical protein
METDGILSALVGLASNARPKSLSEKGVERRG